MTLALFIILMVASLFVQPALALFIGMAFALLLRPPFPALSKKASKYMLQTAVVGLGFGMNLYKSIEAGGWGIALTLLSVTTVLLLGCVIGRWLKLPVKMSYLISSGTAICGGSAIAAVSPVVKADENETSVSLATIYALNALALFLFPPLGKLIGLDETQFGLWAAFAIHDTSSVVGAAASYGEDALCVATTVKLARALWIMPLALVSTFIFLNASERGEGKVKVSIPWFILFFLLAMTANTYLEIPTEISGNITWCARKLLSATLFLIGSGLSVAALRKVGFRPVMLGVSLWSIISLAVLLIVM